MKLLSYHIISLRLPKEYINYHNCSFDINIVNIPTISLHVEAEEAALGLRINVASCHLLCIFMLSFINCLHIVSAVRCNLVNPFPPSGAP